MFVLFGLIVAGFTIFHAVKRLKGSKKHRILLVNIVLAAVAAVSFILLEVDQKAIDSKRSEYRVHSGTILGSISYEKQTPSHLFFHESQLFSSGEFVIRTADADLPWICKLYSPVAIYQSKDAPWGYDTDKIGGKSYPVMQKVEKIVPDYALLFLGFIIIDLFTLAVFDLMMLFRVMLEKKAEGATIDDENEEKTQS